MNDLVEEIADRLDSQTAIYIKMSLLNMSQNSVDFLKSLLEFLASTSKGAAIFAASYGADAIGILDFALPIVSSVVGAVVSGLSSYIFVWKFLTAHYLASEALIDLVDEKLQI